MELSTSTLFGLFAVILFMAALTWVLLRVLPRTRGRLQAETARLDGAGRRSAATLLAGWGPAGGRALAAGVVVFLGCTVVSMLWRSAAVEAVLQGPPTEGNVHYGDAAPRLLGLLAPVLAALVALGVLAWMASRSRAPESEEGVTISAGLHPRGALSFGPRWALALPAVAALVLCGWLVVTGLFSSRDASGRFTVLTVERHASADDPAVGYVGPLTAQTVTADFPGWFVTVPVIVATLALMALTFLLLRSLAQAPRPTSAVLLGVDDLARTLKAKLVATLAGAGLLAALGFVATATGGAMATVAGDLRMTDDGGVEFFYHESMLSGYWIYLAGVLLGLLALVLLVVALGAVLELVAARQVAVAVALGEEPGQNLGSARPA